MQPGHPDAQKYADALVALGKATGLTSRLDADLAVVLDWLEKQPETRRFLSDPLIRDEGKRSTVEALLGERIHPALLYFLFILIDAQVVVALKEIVAGFVRRIAEETEEAAGELLSKQAPAEETLREIERQVGRILGKKVHLRVRVDADMLGGLLVRVGDFVLDGTIDRRLESIRKTLVG